MCSTDSALPSMALPSASISYDVETVLVSRCALMHSGCPEHFQPRLSAECSDSSAPSATEATEPCHLCCEYGYGSKRKTEDLDDCLHFENPSKSNVDADATSAQRHDTNDVLAAGPRKKQRKPHRRVSFSNTPLEFSCDEHPGAESHLPSPLRGHCFTPPIEGLTKANLLALEKELGEDFLEANAQSIIRLKRRVCFASLLMGTFVKVLPLWCDCQGAPPWLQQGLRGRHIICNQRHAGYCYFNC
jgi:hypothetical protein